MKMMTWNVMGNRGIGERRRPKVLDIIREIGPDVVLLQEVHAAKGLPGYLADGLHVSRVATDDPSVGEMSSELERCLS